MSRRARVVMIVVPIIATVALGLAVRSIARSNAAFEGAVPERPVVTKSTRVAGSGVVEPSGRVIAVSNAVPGIVRDVKVRPGALVAEGDLLFVLDDSLARSVVYQRRQDLAAAEARLKQTIARKPQLLAEIEAAQSALEALEAERDEAREQVQTGAQLVGGAVSQRELSRRKNALRSAESRIGEAQARLASARAALSLVDPDQSGASVLVDQQAVEQARAGMMAAEADREQLFVRAPRGGTVLTVDVRPGEFANPSGSITPVSIGLLTPLNVRVDVDEADLPRLVFGAPALAARRGAPDDRIPLTFIRAEPLLQPKRTLSGSIDERIDTRVLQLVYEVSSPDVDLRPGQILDVTISAGRSVAKAE